MYLDVVVDSLLKGLDEQFNSMKYNLADSLIRVVLVLCLLRFWGMESYVGILFFSTIFNAALSLHRLLKVTQVRLSLVWHILLPLGCAGLSVTAGKALLQGIAFPHPLWEAGLQTALSALVFGGLYAGLCKLDASLHRTAKKSGPSRDRHFSKLIGFRQGLRLLAQLLRRFFGSSQTHVPASGK